jgi:hypothetical protein
VSTEPTAAALETAFLSVASGIDDSLTIRIFDSFAAFPSGEAVFLRLRTGAAVPHRLRLRARARTRTRAVGARDALSVYNRLTTK